MRQPISSLVGPESLSLNDAGTAETYPICRVTPSNRVPSATRTMAECPTYCHVVPGHPQPLSMRNTAPKSNLPYDPKAGHGFTGPCRVPSYVFHAATRLILGDQKVWTEPGKIPDP